MTRVSIERIVIDESCLDPGQADSFRGRLQDELNSLFENTALPNNIQNAARVDGGELASATASPRVIAERVVRSLGGKS